MTSSCLRCSPAMAQYFLDFFRNVYRRLSMSASSRYSDIDSDAQIDLSKASTDWLLTACELKLRKCRSIDELYATLSECCLQLSPGTKYCHPFLWCQSLVDAYGHVLPDSGVSSQAIGYEELAPSVPLETSDPLFSLLEPYVNAADLSNVGFVVINDYTDNRPLALVVLVGEDVSFGQTEQETIKVMSEAVSEIYRQRSLSMNGAAMKLINDIGKIDDDIALTHVTVMKHLRREVRADNEFILAYSEIDEDLILKSFEGKVIPERRFATHSLPTLTSFLRNKKPIVTNFTREIKKDVTAVAGKVPASYVILVPIVQCSHAIGIAILLSYTQRFTQEHLNTVTFLLSACSCLLYKDLVLDRERTLRKQTERLHQVARNIFTHLGDVLRQLISDSYKRLIDLVMLPDIPSVIRPTNHTLDYQNIYIPRLNMQRITSIDNHLVVLGPCSQKHSVEIPVATRSCSAVSDGTVISDFDLGVPMNDWKFPSQKDANVDESASGNSPDMPVALREKLEDISEETGASNADVTVVGTESPGCLGLQKPLSTQYQAEENNVLRNINNNSDREEKKTPLPNSKEKDEDDKSITSQILNLSADVHPLIRPSRNTSVLSLSQRPSLLAMTGSQTNIPTKIDRSSLILKSVNARSRHNLPKNESVLSTIPTLEPPETKPKKSIFQEDGFLIEDRKLDTNRSSRVVDRLVRGRPSLIQSARLTSLHPLTEDNYEHLRGSVCSSSENNVRLSNEFESALKTAQDRIHKQQMPVPTTTKELHYTRPTSSVVDRTPSNAHLFDSQLHTIVSHDYVFEKPHLISMKAKSLEDDPVTYASNQTDAEHENKLCTVPLSTTYVPSNEQQASINRSRIPHQSSRVSNNDLARSNVMLHKGKTKKTESLHQRLSVMSLNSRAKEPSDSRIRIADKYEQKTPLNSLDNDLINMTLSAAEGASGPFKRSPSRQTSLAANIRQVDHRIPMKSGYSLIETRSLLPEIRNIDLGSPTKVSVGVQSRCKTQNVGIQTSSQSVDPNLIIYSKQPKTDLEGKQTVSDGNLRSNGSISGVSNISLPCYARSTPYLVSIKEPTTVAVPSQMLLPLVAPLSTTVIPNMTSLARKTISKRKSRSVPSCSDDYMSIVDSDYRNLFGRNNSKDHKDLDKYEVEVKDLGTGDAQTHWWRRTTLKLCKLSPVTNCYGLDDHDLTVLLKEIMQEARALTEAEKCSVFLMDNESNELVAKVFDGDIADNQEVRISSTEGIAGHVVQTGKILSIKDAYSSPLFYRGVDESTGFKTRNILCFPIKDERDNIIGAAQLCNKKGNTHFTSVDEDIARALSTYCCISIVHSLMYRDVLDAHNRVKLASELMVFHMHVPSDEVLKLANQLVPPINEFGEDLYLKDFRLSLPRYVETNSMPLAIISMFQELNLIQTFKIKSVTLSRFILMARKGYRDPPYHNWFHAFSVAHFAFLLLKNLDCVGNGILEDLEALAFLVAALCHDIDHRGTSNSFQVASNSVLAALYSSEGSVMERHHFSQTMCILNTEGCNIFENVSRTEYEHLLDLIRDVILSTDIAHHLRIRNGLETMANEGFDKTNPEHKSLLMCLFMTSSDLSDHTKPWKAAKKVSKMLYREFFSQGDLEKALGQNPMEMMDREKASIPTLQINFIDHIVLPAYKTLQVVFPVTECLVENIMDNREHWVAVNNAIGRHRGSIASLEIFDYIDAEDDKLDHTNSSNEQ